MKNTKLIYLLLVGLVSISCNSKEPSTTETKEKLEQKESRPKSQTNAAQQAIQDSLFDQAAGNMKRIADKLCAGMKVDEIYNYQLDGRSIGYYMSQDTNRVNTNNLEAYKAARRRAQCCLDATVQHKKCEYLKTGQ